MGLHTPIDFGWNRWGFANLAFQSRSFPFENEPFSDAVDAVVVHAQSLGNLPTRQSAPLAIDIAPQQDLGMPDLLGRVASIARDVRQRLPLFGRETNRIQIWR
jgi:hypothetical protein